MEIRNKIRAFIEKNLIMFDETDFTDEDNIFWQGFVNSLFAMKLLTFVEHEFGIVIDNESMDLANFSSINNIVALVNRKLNQ